jgi:hypothetical protein
VQGLSNKNGMQNAKSGFCGLEDVAETAAGNYYLAFGVGAPSSGQFVSSIHFSSQVHCPMNLDTKQ